MRSRTKLVLKISGTIAGDQNNGLNSLRINELAQQIIQLKTTHQILLVIGGGNILRGAQQAENLGVSAVTAHQLGMLATCFNGTLITDVFMKAGITTTHLSAFACPDIAEKAHYKNMQKAAMVSDVIVVSGGTGNPFFSTDTAAILRALEFGTKQVFKGTNVNGIYTADPQKDVHATLLPHTTFQYALEQSLAVMDETALVLARQHNLTVKIFNIFMPNALIKALNEQTVGSMITN